MPPKDIYDDIQVAAGRIATYANSIREAHSMGHGPGAIDELWSREFQEKAMQIYPLTIPWDYLANLGSQFKMTARQMTIAATPGDITNEWFIIAEYLRIASETIVAYSPAGSSEETSEQLAPRTPAVMQFGLLAEIASAAGAAELETAAQAVHDTLQALDTTDETPSPLSQSQTQILALLATGNTVADIADQVGYSTRSIQRQLNEAKDLINVATSHEALAIALKHGWLEPTAGSSSVS